MNYLSAEQLSKAYGERVLFENLSFGINEGQKIGLIAKNGSGKTAILRILAGEDQPDSGQVVYRKSIAMAYLPQRPQLDETLTVEETIFSGEHETLSIIARYEKALQNPNDTESYQAAFEAMEAAQAWDFETQYKQMLSKLKLENLSQKVKLLSGGQKRRLALAQTLLQKPDLLLLDEPTNHLDLEMIEWL